MKKPLCILLIATMSIAVTAACSQNSDMPPANEQQNRTSVNEINQDAGISSDAISDTAAYIGEERAKEIAIERAGITSDGVVFDRIELDRDNGIWQYELDFRQGRNEYDADIKADDGTILSFESDYDD